MKNKISTLLIILFTAITTFAQVPSWIWAKSAGGGLNDGAYSIAVDASGNTFVAGTFESATITFGTITLTNSATDSMEIFLVKYDPNGIALWARSAGGINNDEATSVATDPSGNVVVAEFSEALP